MRRQLAAALIVSILLMNVGEASPRRDRVSKRALAALVTASLIAGYLPGHALGAPVKQADQICRVFEQHPSWRTAAQKAAAKHGVPIAEFMAINFAESGLDPGARNSESSATGLCQATTATWKDYKRANPQQVRAKRTVAEDCIDFSAWRVRDVSDQINHGKLLPPREAAKAYKAGPRGYLDGVPGAQPGEYRDYAQKVHLMAEQYDKQLGACGIENPPAAERAASAGEKSRGLGGFLYDLYFDKVHQNLPWR